MKRFFTLLIGLIAIVGTAGADNYIKGSWDWNNSGTVSFDSEGLGTVTITGLAAATTYEFYLLDNSDGDKYWKNAGTMSDANCIGWEFATGDISNAHITTTVAGNYTFKVKWVNSKPQISAVYPTANQYVVHFQKGNSWSSVYAYRYWVTTTIYDAKWPGTQISENANNSDYYDAPFQDTFNRITFSDSGSNTNKSGDVEINFSYPETWVTDNATIQTTPPEGWVGHTRTVSEGNFGTICLPFNATVTGATVFKIVSTVGSGESMTGINLESVDELEAGKSYIFKATGSTLTATYLTSASYTAASAGYGMMGNLSSTPATVDNGNYIISGNKIHKVNGATVTVGQYRGYITLAGIGEASARGANFIGFEDEQATGIDLNVNDNLNSDATMYNLAGQRVSENYKGIVVKNGKKFINK